jgi:Mg-chelatase subunit ChlD
MNFVLADLRRAALAGGDISAFCRVYAEALGCPPELVPADLTRPLNLGIYAGTADAAWAIAEVKGPPPAAGKSGGELSLLGFAEPQKGTRAFLARLIDDLTPGLVLLDLAPIELSAWRAYSHSLDCALGLAVGAQVISTDLAEGLPRISFEPGSLSEAAVLHCAINNIPIAGISPPPSSRALTPVPNQGFSDLEELEAAVRPVEPESTARDYDAFLATCRDVATALRRARIVSQAGLQRLGADSREKTIDEARYLASRAFDLLHSPPVTGRTKVLALIKLQHLTDFEYILGLLQQGLMSETYLPPKGGPEPHRLTLTGRVTAAREEQPDSQPGPEGLGQILFSARFNDYVKSVEAKDLSPDEARLLVSHIARRTRTLPEIKRGVSVRGSLAFQEIVQGLALIEGHLTPRVVQKAAMISLPPRLLLAKSRDPRKLVEEITKEEIFQMRFGHPDKPASSPADPRSINAEALKQLRAIEKAKGSVPAGQPDRGAPAVVESQPDVETLSSLERKNLLRRDENGQYSLTRKALRYLMDDLERRFKSGEIDEAEYQKQKSRLVSKMSKLSQPQYSLSRGELASTVMEMIDAQDRQWNSEINFNALHVYYHIKDSAEGAFLSPQKRDYFALKRLIDDMATRNIISPTQDSGGFVLTALALEVLLKQLIRPRKDSPASRLSGRSPIPGGERKHEVRRYSSCDPFRAISFRHTLREAARQRKELNQLRRADFRVFLKLNQKPRLDIVLCLDTSGSMGFQQKLIYARLAAAGLIESALKEGHRVGIVAFNDRGQVSVPLTDSNRSGLLNCLATLVARGNTNVGDGIRASREILAGAPGKNQQNIILISDGQPSAISQNAYDHLQGSAGRDLTQESAFFETRLAVASGIQLSVIHVAARNESSDTFMKELARFGRGGLARVARPEDLTRLLAN